MISVAYGAHEQGDATDSRARDKADRPVDTERRLGDADLTNLRWHVLDLSTGAQLSRSRGRRSVMRWSASATVRLDGCAGKWTLAVRQLVLTVVLAKCTPDVALSAINSSVLGEDTCSRVRGNTTVRQRA